MTGAPKIVQVAVYLNRTEDAFGRSVGLMDGFQPGHLLEGPVLTYSDILTDGVNRLLERAFDITNVGHDPAFTNPPDLRAIEYRAADNRSLSVGDVVTVDSDAWAVASFGWDQVQLSDAQLVAREVQVA